MAKMVRIESYETRAEAELAASVLEAAGIPSYVGADDYGRWLPLQLGRFRARLLVNEDDVPRALRVLEDYYESGEFEPSEEEQDSEEEVIEEDSLESAGLEDSGEPAEVETPGFSLPGYILWFIAPALICIIVILIRGCG